MCHLSDQTFGRSASESRVRIQRNHVADVDRRDGEAAANGYKGSIGRATKPSIQLVQLAPFAFPPDPLALPLAPEAPAMQQEEARTPAEIAPDERDSVSYLIAVARGRKKPAGLSSLENNMIVTEILTAARESAKTGKSIAIPAN